MCLKYEVVVSAVSVEIEGKMFVLRWCRTDVVRDVVLGNRCQILEVMGLQLVLICSSVNPVGDVDRTHQTGKVRNSCLTWFDDSQL